MTPQQIKEARQTLGLSQVKMATLCGSHRDTWIQWETGRRTPGAIALQYIKCLLWLYETGQLDEWALKKEKNEKKIGKLSTMN